MNKLENIQSIKQYIQPSLPKNGQMVARMFEGLSKNGEVSKKDLVVSTKLFGKSEHSEINVTTQQPQAFM